MNVEATEQRAETIVLDSGEGEALWFNNDLLTLKATGVATGGAFLLLEELAHGGKVTPLHLHPHEAESFYVLEGEILLHVDGSERALGPGGFASVPAGVAHAYLVTSERSRMLGLITPDSGAMEDFFRTAGQPAGELALPDPTPLDMERIKAAAQSSGAVEILGPPPFAQP